MPVLANIAGEKELIEGGELLIHCYVLMGNPKPRIEWLKNGRPMDATELAAMLQVDDSLLLKNGSEKDAALYTCRVIY